jgi:hypothetical protein
MKQFKTINQNKADIEIGYKEQKQHLIDIMKSDEESGLYDEPKFVTVNMESATGEDLGRVSYIPIPNVDYIPKQETLEEAAEKYNDEVQKSFGSTPPHIKNVHLMYHFTKGAEWAQKRMYSEEEVIKILYQFHYDLVNSNFDTKEEWFEQFKKK